MASRLYLQMLVAVAAGVAVGHFAPHVAPALKPLADVFLGAVKILVAPVVFCTVVLAIAHSADLKAVGRVGLKALVYFEAVSTLSLAIGLGVGEWIRPGEGLRLSPVAVATKASASGGNAFTRPGMLHVLFLAVAAGLLLSRLGAPRIRAVALLERASRLLFRALGWLMRLSPLAALGAMAFTVGEHGIGALAGLGKLLLCFYGTSLLFVLLVLGSIVRTLGLRLLPLLRHFREELLLVLGTSSSEAALSGLLTKLEALGCPPRVVKLVVPLGYSFNLDGTSLYLTLASLFLAQATGTRLSFLDELGLLAVLLLTSKGAAAVTGGGFIALSATLSTTHRIPVSSLTLLLGVDRFMSEARALTNLVGNVVATLVVSRWEGELDVPATRQRLETAR